jgi:hypothetical protein
MADTDIIITEILYDAPNIPGLNDNKHEWVEIANTGPDPVSLNGWTLDDVKTANTPVGIIPNVTLAAGQIAIFYNASITEQQFIAQYSPLPGTVLIPVTHWQPLNNTGDTVNLINASGTVIEQVAYAPVAAPGESLNYTTGGVYEGPGVPDPGIVCFTAGSRIATARGARPIEALEVGDLVLTKDHGLQPLRWIGQRVISLAEQISTPTFRPVLIKKSAIAANQPECDMQVSQQHRLLLDNHQTALLFGIAPVLCPAASLVNRHSITVAQTLRPVTYIHLLFDQHEIVYVDGLQSESFHPSQAGLDKLSNKARQEIYALFPALKQGGEMAIAYPALNAVEAVLLDV